MQRVCLRAVGRKPGSNNQTIIDIVSSVFQANVNPPAALSRVHLACTVVPHVPLNELSIQSYNVNWACRCYISNAINFRR